jgi:hypothetical protein
MRRMLLNRDGQVWAEKWKTNEVMFMVIGEKDDCYRLLCLEDGEEDSISELAFSLTTRSWRRVI